MKGKIYGLLLIVFTAISIIGCVKKETLPATIPVVTTAASTNVTTTTLTSGGAVTSDGRSTVTARGVCWSTNPLPTVSDSKTSDGTGTGTFVSSVTGLTAGTNYYLRAYATNNKGTAYGDQIIIQTSVNLPTINTAAVTQITSTTALGGGDITVGGQGTIIVKGICWSKNQNPTTADSKVDAGIGLGSFTASMTGLTASTVYYVRAYATNSAGTSYGTQVTFTTTSTAATAATITTTAVTAITANNAVSGGNVTSDGGGTIISRGVCWNTTGTPTVDNFKTSDAPLVILGNVNPLLTANATDFSSSNVAAGPYVSTLTSLLPVTTYYVRAYVITSAGTSYGSQLTFTTLASTATITTTTISAITSSSAISGGTITSDGGAAVTARGVCWGTTSLPVITGNITTDGLGTGTFVSNISGLVSGTTYYLRAYATNSIGTVYGNQLTFVATAANLPSITTKEVWSLTDVSASTGGVITGDGGAAIIARGVCWGTTSLPVVTGNKTTDGTGTGSFNSVIPSLQRSTLYYARAYATNSVGTSYGNQITFTTYSVKPVITTVAVTAYDPFTGGALSGGNTTDDGGSRITQRGVCWSANMNPTTDNSKTNNGAGYGPFVSNLTGLVPVTTYYVRSYAINDAGTMYGNQVSFTTPQALPTITTTSPATDITAISATGGGNVTYLGGALSLDRGICWSTSTNPTTADSHTTTTGSITGIFTNGMTGLSANTLYHFRAYATNLAGTSYGTDVTFTTLYAMPTVTTTSPATTITYNSATGGGNVTYLGGALTLTRGICWSTTAEPTTSDNHTTTSGSSTGIFTDGITGLDANTLYHFRAYATNPLGTSYGTDVTFTTLYAMPTVTTSAATTITAISATGGGNVTYLGGASSLDRGICWSTSHTPTTSSNIAHTTGSITGVFTNNMTGLTPNTTYYFRAYATNPAGTSYGDELSFITHIPTVAITTGPTNITTVGADISVTVTNPDAYDIEETGVLFNKTSAGLPTYGSSQENEHNSTHSTLTSLIRSFTENDLDNSSNYYARPYARINMGGTVYTVYGTETTFSTLTLPTVTVSSGPTSIDHDGANFSVTVSNPSGLTVTEVGILFRYYMSGDPTTGNNNGSEVDPSSSTSNPITRNFHEDDLSGHTWYNYRPYCKVTIGGVSQTIYGSTRDFSTTW